MNTTVRKNTVVKSNIDLFIIKKDILNFPNEKHDQTSLDVCEILSRSERYPSWQAFSISVINLIFCSGIIIL